MTSSADGSNGYEAAAAAFMAARSARIGVATVRGWARTLGPGRAVLDLGCGHGVPITQTLIEEGLSVHGVDASPALIAAFRERFPGAQAACERVEDSAFFNRTFDGAVAWGLLFLLPAGTQARLIHKVAGALAPGGRFLFTSPSEAGTWADALTGRESVSLGSQEYSRILAAEGLVLSGEDRDEGDNHYYFSQKPS